MNFDTFLSDVLSGIVSGTFLTLIFFFVKEKIFSYPEIDGKWYFEIETVNTAYIPYQGMKLYYVAFISYEGDKITGSIEKIYELSSARTQELIGTERIRGIVKGCFEKFYFSKDKMRLHIIENGKIRESSHYFDLSAVTSHEMTGKFFSTIADQSGNVKWQRDSFQ